MENQVVIKNMDDYRTLEDIVKQRLGAKEVVVLGVLENGDFCTFVPNGLLDNDLVYLIQLLNDRRTARLQG